ncbi:hypothetical protein KKG29_02915 [Patescibacteria group bacterium]|nr:hypothetical protein [Patescibacteria group bacterium]MBU4000102.1 hypothetical protein [Patescibacteria group bacterium]MBU4056773.1 hypothetical protein [Patescibacteria group bacterium]MBU4368184.1 hypothetical protein [Patescibacteria group bacterium]
MPKLKTAIISLTCCEGCQFAILDLGEKLLEVAEILNLEKFELASSKKGLGPYDIIFVEGTPITKENVVTLIKARREAKILVALGTCADLGGVAEIKNYSRAGRGKMLEYVYKNIEGIDNPKIKPISVYVKVDAKIPGCPIEKKEFLKFVRELGAGKIYKIPDIPVCYECQLKENSCLLQEGKPCFGPVTLAGCGAICPSNNFICEACRGPIRDRNLTSLKKILGKKMAVRELMKIAEIHGVKDDLEKNNL